MPRSGTGWWSPPLVLVAVAVPVAAVAVGASGSGPGRRRGALDAVRIGRDAVGPAVAPANGRARDGLGVHCVRTRNAAHHRVVDARLLRARCAAVRRRRCAPLATAL